MLKRTIDKLIKNTLKISPIVLILGARQIGKSSLVYNYSGENIIGFGEKLFAVPFAFLL